MDRENLYDHDKQALLRDLENKKEGAVDYLFRTYYADLCHFARGFVDVYEDAEEAVQNVFEKIWTNGVRLQGKESLDSYLYVAVRNACVSIGRRQIRRVGLEEVADLPVEDTGEKEEGRNAALWEAVNSLPEQCRVILKLVVLEEMKYAEVAEKLGISLNTVKTQMKIAYRELRGKLSGKQLFLLFFQMKV